VYADRQLRVVDADAAGLRPDVQSECGRLRAVLLHRPGDELHAVDPGDPGRALFAAEVDTARAQAEHDAFAAVLRAHGVEVVYLHDLLAEAVGDHALLQEPLPNLMFVRDSSAWVGPGVVLGRMATAARRQESRLLEAIYRLHPRFAGAPIWTDASPAQPRIEGGDVIVAGEGHVVVGISERTSATGARRVVTALLSCGAARRVTTLRLPPGAGFHLDLAMSVVAPDAVAFSRHVRHALRGHRWRAGRSGIVASAVSDPLEAFPGRPHAIEIGDGAKPSHGRAWDRGVNVLALRPGLVVAYADNAAANAELEAAGIDVIRIGGAALAGGRGGPRCLSCPLVRDRT
jgi:arginine deiminase